MRRKLILAVSALGLAALAALGFYWPWRHRSEVLRLPGVVEIQEVRLGSKVGGRVAQINTHEGELVPPGKELVVFEAPELEAQHEQDLAQLQTAEADLEKARNGPRVEEKEAARAAVEAAQAHWQRLKTGFREEEIRQAKQELESAEADLKLAREDFARAAVLYQQQTLSRADYDAARAARDRAQSQASAARAHYDLYTRGSRPEEIAEAAGQLAQAKANYDLLLAGTRSEDIAAAMARVAEAKAKVQEVEANLKEAHLRAPERSIVEVLSVRPGDLATPNQAVVRVLRADDLWVKVYVPETELGKIHLNQRVEVTMDSYPGKRYAGTIFQIASESEFTPRNVQSADERRHQVFALKVHVDDPQGDYKSGMAAEVQVPLQEAPP
ncbi:MAG: efflux RND transporter periplasmic adaptor subunit [Planctomycetes bacterium]|nr:efflux RND transporter periplasmic adaptor subunit [Planctomycetota bacterium]